MSERVRQQPHEFFHDRWPLCSFCDARVDGGVLREHASSVHLWADLHSTGLLARCPHEGCTTRVHADWRGYNAGPRDPRDAESVRRLQEAGRRAIAELREHERAAHGGTSIESDVHLGLRHGWDMTPESVRAFHRAYARGDIRLAFDLPGVGIVDAEEWAARERARFTRA